MRITVTGATGLIGTNLVAALKERGDEVTVLSRRPEDAQRLLGVDALGWDPGTEPAPAQALAGRDGVVHLAGEPIAQRWTQESKNRIRSSRELGTANLVRGLEQCEPRPGVLVSASAVGYYGARGDERLDEGAPPGTGFLAEVCDAWEQAAGAASRLGIRVVMLRTGVLLDRADGALARMLPPFRLGVGGPVAGGDQYISWIAP
ncbi:MAG TPA: NAD-dependent epimerase/dehydratase family protein, partial [Gaiellaceae bacterium]|nr:NAD-dependent epimerase/dehydratase family protein [Gaiellaceae bacterium]